MVSVFETTNVCCSGVDSSLISTGNRERGLGAWVKDGGVVGGEEQASQYID